MSSDNHYDYLYKIILIGDSNVGKTCILSRFTNNTFNPLAKATVGVEFANKSVEVDQHIIRAQIWDTAGQERFRAITNAYYRGAVGALIVFDITDRHSFTNVQSWYDELQSYANSDIVVMLVGNKCDLSDQRQISKEEAIDYSKEHNMAYIETSAKNATGVVEAFKSIIKQIYELLKEKQMQQDKPSLNMNTLSQLSSVNNSIGKDKPAVVDLKQQKKADQSNCGC